MCRSGRIRGSSTQGIGKVKDPLTPAVGIVHVVAALVVSAGGHGDLGALLADHRLGALSQELNAMKKKCIFFSTQPYRGVTTAGWNCSGRASTSRSKETLGRRQESASLGVLG